MSSTTISWYGEFDDHSEANLKRLSDDLGVSYSQSIQDGKRLFRFRDLDEEKSLWLVSRIRKYGLAVSTTDPLSGLIKTNYEALQNMNLKKTFAFLKTRKYWMSWATGIILTIVIGYFVLDDKSKLPLLLILMIVFSSVMTWLLELSLFLLYPKDISLAPILLKQFLAWRKYRKLSSSPKT